VTADSKSINYAEVEPEFSFQYGALVDGDEMGVIDTPPSCSVLDAVGTRIRVYQECIFIPNLE
jgi:hypothetical protein